MHRNRNFVIVLPSKRTSTTARSFAAKSKAGYPDDGSNDPQFVARSRARIFELEALIPNRRRCRRASH